MHSQIRKYCKRSLYEDNHLENAMTINNQLTLHTNSHFNGLPVDLSHGPLVAEFLEKGLETIQRSLADHNRVFAVRVDLRFPKWYWPIDNEVLGNDYLTRFTESLRAKIDHERACGRREGKRVHRACLRRIWAREHDSEGQKPHFHLVILLNANAFNSLGRFGSGHRNMMTRMKEAWASALGEPMIVDGLVHICGQHEVSLRDLSSLAALYFHTSYLAKVRSKSFVGNSYPFGCSTK